MFFIYLILINNLNGVCMAENTIFTDEHLLYRILLNNYEPSVRPVLNHNQILNVNFGLKLTQVLELSEKDQTLITNIWIEQHWFDEFLKWNASEFSGINSLRMPTSRIWLPDTYIYNCASLDNSQGSVSGPYAMVNSNGLVKFPVPMKLRSNCEVDIAYFPFDQQICYIKFASWLYDLSAVNFTPFDDNNVIVDSNLASNIDLSGYLDNSGWILLNVNFYRRQKNHPNGIYPELIYLIHIKRRYLYYVFNVILPCAMLSILTCLTFWLPCASGEKVTLGLTCFVAYSVFMLMVAEKVPTTSETVPIISVYLTIVMSFTSVSVIMAVVVTNLNEKTKHQFTKENRMPKIMRQIFFKGFGKFLGIKRQARDLLKKMVKFKGPLNEVNKELRSWHNSHFDRNKLDTNEIWIKNEMDDLKDFELKKNYKYSNYNENPGCSKSFELIDKNEYQIGNKIEMSSEILSNYFAYEYALAALILDRIFFCLYASFILLSYFITLLVFPFLVQPSSKPFMQHIP